jgi:endonuclease/exonuclease/phosphatase family metal-dependent hydrolase
MKLSKTLQQFISVVILVAACGVCARAKRLIIVGWNIESGGATDAAVAQRVRTFQSVDLWGLSEVGNDTTLQAFEVAAEDGENGADFQRILSVTGCGDQLGIVYNATRLTLVGSQELHRATYNADTPPPGRCQRSPLVAEFVDTRSTRRFLFMVNHLARGDNDLRRDQGQRLNDWVRTQTLPVIACGDYNFDWRVNNGEQSYDVGFDRMTADNHWSWVRPGTLLSSQCNPEFNSVLDFCFVNAAARPFALASEILQAANDCGNAAANPDHLPLRTEFELGAIAPAPTRAEILQRLEAIERQIQELRTLIQRLP